MKRQHGRAAVVMDSYSGYRFQALRGRDQQREEERGVPGAEHFHKLMTAIVGSHKWRNKLMSGEDESFEKSQGSSVSHSLVKVQEIKCYQAQSGTSPVKIK